MILKDSLHSSVSTLSMSSIDHITLIALQTTLIKREQELINLLTPDENYIHCRTLT